MRRENREFTVGSGVVLGLVAAIALAAGCAGTTALQKKRVVVLDLEKSGAPAVQRTVTDLVTADYELIPAEDYWLLAARIRAESREADDVARVAEYADADAVVTAELVPAGGKRATLVVSLREVAGGSVVARYEIPVRAGAVTKRGQRKLAARVRPELAEITGLAWQRAARERAAAGEGTDAAASGHTERVAASSSRGVERPVKPRPAVEQRRAAKAKQKRTANAGRVAKQERAGNARRIAKPKRAAKTRRITKQKRAANARRIAKQKRAAKTRRIAKQKRAANARRIAKRKRAAKTRRIAKQKRAANARRIAKQKRAANARRIAKQKRAAKTHRIAKQKRAAKSRRIAKQKRAANARRGAQREQPARARQTRRVATGERAAPKPRDGRRVAAASPVKRRAERASAVDDVDPTPLPPVQYDNSGQALDDEVPAALK